MGRRVLTGVTLLVLLVVLGGMAKWGVDRVLKPFPPLELSAPTPKACTTGDPSQKKLYRKQVTVSVYNTSSRSGLASEALARLEANNFLPGTTGNAGDVTVRVAEVRTTVKDDPAAQLVADNLGPGTKVVLTQETYGPGVDVFVGPGFKDVVKGAPFQVALTSPLVTCDRPTPG